MNKRQRKKARRKRLAEILDDVDFRSKLFASVLRVAKVSVVKSHLQVVNYGILKKQDLIDARDSLLKAHN